MARRYAVAMPSIAGPYEPPFDPRDRPPTWLVPLAALNRRPTTMLVIAKRASINGWIVLAGAGSEDLWVRCCSRCRSADCLSCAMEAGAAGEQSPRSGGAYIRDPQSTSNG